MLIAGVCNCGPDPLLTGSVPAKIGEKVNAQAAVSGVVNGKLFNGSKALGKRNQYVSNDVSQFAHLRKHCCGNKNISKQIPKHFCHGNKVSWFAHIFLMFPAREH